MVAIIFSSTVYNELKKVNYSNFDKKKITISGLNKSSTYFLNFYLNAQYMYEVIFLGIKNPYQKNHLALAMKIQVRIEM